MKAGRGSESGRRGRMQCVSQRADGQSFNALLCRSLDVGTCSSEASPEEVPALLQPSSQSLPEPSRNQWTCLSLDAGFSLSQTPSWREISLKGRSMFPRYCDLELLMTNVTLFLRLQRTGERIRELPKGLPGQDGKKLASETERWWETTIKLL